MSEQRDASDEALLQNFDAVASARYEEADASASNAERSELQQGLAETHEQVGDDYLSGGNEQTFLRVGKDLGKADGFRPK